MESVEEINQDLVELKEEALDLGIEFSERIGYDTLKKRVDEKLEELASKKREAKKLKEEIKSQPKIKCIISHKEGDDYKVQDQFFGFTSMKTGVSERILVKFDEEVEISQGMYDYIKGLGFNEVGYTTVNDADGIPQKKLKKKWKKRFIVERTDV